MTDNEMRKAVLCIDEPHRIPGWSRKVKSLYDRDRVTGTLLKVVLTISLTRMPFGSMEDSLAGRYEIIQLC